MSFITLKKHMNKQKPLYDDLNLSSETILKLKRICEDVQPNNEK